VLLALQLQLGLGVSTTTKQEDRMKEALDAGALLLSQEHVEAILAAGKREGPRRRFWKASIIP